MIGPNNKHLYYLSVKDLLFYSNRKNIFGIKIDDISEVFRLTTNFMRRFCLVALGDAGWKGKKKIGGFEPSGK